MPPKQEFMKLFPLLLSVWSVLHVTNGFVTGFVPSSLHSVGTTHIYPHTPSGSSTVVSSSPSCTRLYEKTAAETADDVEIAEITDNGKNTLYNLLRVSPNATKPELKKSYVALARETHPDAMISRQLEDIDVNLPEFTEVATAWRILGDAQQRKRYDRSLMAEDFTEGIDKLATDLGKSAGPKVAKVIERVAMPFLVRTVTSSIAGVSAAAGDLTKKEGKVNVFSVFGAAFKASRRAGQAMDDMELTEKSDKLEKRANDEAEKAIKLKLELDAVVGKRLELSLRTTNASLSSAEAIRILETLDKSDEDDQGVVTTQKDRDNLLSQINALENAESEYFANFGEKSVAQGKTANSRESLTAAENEEMDAIDAESRAQKALNDAKKRVIQARLELSEASKLFLDADKTTIRSSADKDMYTVNLVEQQEQVRLTLLEKSEELRKNKNGRRGDVYGDTGSGLEEIERLLRKERFMKTESTRFEDRAERLRSRAAKIKKRTDEKTGLLEEKKNEAK